MSDENTHSAADAPAPPGSEILQGEPAQPGSDDGSATERSLARDVAALVATVDQLGSEVDAINVTVIALAFMLGALGGVVFLLARHVQGLPDALAD